MLNFMQCDLKVNPFPPTHPSAERTLGLKCFLAYILSNSSLMLYTVALQAFFLVYALGCLSVFRDGVSVFLHSRIQYVQVLPNDVKTTLVIL